jgi:hypothetical protein
MKTADTWNIQKPTTEDSLPDLAWQLLQGNDSGVAEQAADTAKNNSEAIGRLLEVLVKNHILTEKTALSIIDRYSRYEVVP